MAVSQLNHPINHIICNNFPARIWFVMMQFIQIAAKKTSFPHEQLDEQRLENIIGFKHDNNLGGISLSTSRHLTLIHISEDATMLFILRCCFCYNFKI